MNNFQLYRTNLYLGGQMKWDLIINSSTNGLYVDDFHLSPISNNIPYTFKSEDNLLKNKHQDNVKLYYNKIKGYFYNEGLDSKFCHNWPLLCKPNDIVDCYSNIYDMGCKRTKRYNLYKKQLEFFCPVWIEKLTGDLEFKIKIYFIGSNTPLSTNVLKLSKNTIARHNKFVEYFNKYINDCGLIEGSDNLINIHFNSYTSMITGLNAADGTFVTKSIDSLVNNITLRERPVMEVDNMIIESFVNNNIVCKQLFNFNLCFDVTDIISGAITSMLTGQKINVSVDVYMNGIQLDKKDFYTNYEFINKQQNTSIQLNETYNVFDYLNDNNCIDTINKNKFCQSICHWSMCDNNDYIFNVYNGFSGLNVEKVIDKNNNETIYVHENEHQYGNTADTIIKKFDKNKNSTGWINVVNITKWNDFYKYIKNTEKYKIDASYIGDSQYINNIKYRTIPTVNNKGFYALGMIIPGNLLYGVVDSFSECQHLYNNELYCLLKDDLLLLMTSNPDNLAFGKLSDILDYINKTDWDGINSSCIDYIKAVYKLITNKIDPEMIVFGGGLLWHNANGPSANIKEISYYKDNLTQEYIFRYDGKISPAFIDVPKNILYYKDYVSDDNDNGNSRLKHSKYMKYLNSGYEPLYPSIDYCAIKKITNWTYDNIPMISPTEYDNDIKLYSTPEYSWFNSNVIIIMQPELSFTYINKQKPDGTYENINSIVRKLLKSVYHNNTDTEIEYIMSKYNIENNWEYYSDTNINDYKYSVYLKLK